MSYILEINRLTKRYPHFALQDVTFSLERGYIMGFIGPNGAGKSTTIKLIMNLIKKDSGEIRLFGLDHLQHELEVKEKIGFVYDENPYYEELTGEEMKQLVRPFYRRWDEATFRMYSEQFQLPLKRPIRQLSKGMKMKLALAIALSHQPELLIMDEPTSGLDPLVRVELLEILQSVVEDEHRSVFFSTHITSDLEKVADYITLIHEGKILFCQPKDVLLEEYCIVKGSREKLQEWGREGFVGIQENRYGFEGLYANKQEACRRFGDSVLIERPTLEEIMVYMTRKRDAHVSSH